MEAYVLITGASRGIGAAIAQKLAGQNYNLILTCCNSGEELQRIAKELSEAHQIHVLAEVCDIGNPEEVDALFKRIPHPDIIINNAGISHVGLIQDMDITCWNSLLATNLSAAFYTTKYGLPHMLRQGSGRILNISSVWGLHGASLEVAYSASKGGLNTYTKALAKEVAPSGIAVNALACGLIDTQMNAHLSSDELEALCDEIPAGRPATVSEVADAVSHILQMPHYFTGQIITLDGGWM